MMAFKAFIKPFEAPQRSGNENLSEFLTFISVETWNLQYAKIK